MNQASPPNTLLVKLVRAFGRARARLGAFLITAVLVFAGTVGVAASLDVLPEGSGAELAASPALISADEAKVQPELPTLIRIPPLDRELPIANPVTTEVAVLDRALQSATVRYPTSAKLGEDGNVIVFGHSSHLPIVRNDLFKAFNDIETLEEGDEIVVVGSAYEYVYTVETVESANAEADAIPLRVDGKKLTLATCDSFGTKSGRFIVTAGLAGVREIGSSES